MNSHKLPVGSFIRFEKPQLQAVIDRLRQLGYRTVGPRRVDEAIVYDDLRSIDELPVGYLDFQDGGVYRLRHTADGGWFDYVVGPHSLKNFLFPPRDRVLEAHREPGGWRMETPAVDEPPIAAIGVRSCDLHALAIQDRVFLEQEYVDPAYRARRANLFVLAINCRRAAATCFCHSMNTGPQVTRGYDLAATEVDDYFVVEVGSEPGGHVVTAADWVPAALADVERTRQQSQALKRRMHSRQAAAATRPRPSGPNAESAPAAEPGPNAEPALAAESGAVPEIGAVRESDATQHQPLGRFLDTRELPELLLNNLGHPRWEQVAQRCLSCANCTLVCPTCFCSSVEEVSDLTGEHVVRQRSWASCFTAEHSYMNSGTVRKTTASRYRQWLTHKLATWHEQFGTSGCVGCGRCITWCPVGIDLTQEVAAIRGDES